MKRRADPASLAEKVAAEGSTCPVPFTHDRLDECHHWWHEIARNYHEPDPFRYCLGAFVQAARSVTYMLQKEKSAFEDFNWYAEWVRASKKNPLLVWLNGVRTELVHRSALTAFSTLELRCLKQGANDPIDPQPARSQVSPFRCTHTYIGPDFHGDHPHEFAREWRTEGIADWELLNATATIFDSLADLVHTAHEKAGAHLGRNHEPGERHRLPCMDDLAKHLVIRTEIVDGREVWIDEPQGTHSHP